MGPMIDGVWRIERGATGASLLEGCVAITLCMVERQRERRRRREGEEKEEEEGREEAATISCPVV